MKKVSFKNFLVLTLVPIKNVFEPSYVKEIKFEFKMIIY